MLVIPFPSSVHVITAVCQSCQPVTLRFVLLIDKITTMISSVSNLVYHGYGGAIVFFLFFTKNPTLWLRHWSFLKYPWSVFISNTKRREETNVLVIFLVCDSIRFFWL